MSSAQDVFRFKMFDISQLGCAMKINTDGVLLAATVMHELPETILDIGTGTGVISMMLAQRFEPAKIDAVEIDTQAAAAVRKNFENSPFQSRMEVYNLSIEEFNPDVYYDLIVSNPPFFVNDLKNQEKRKGIARHADKGFFDMLVKKSASMLSATGSFWLILPVKQAEEIESISLGIGLAVSEKIFVHSDAHKAAFRVILCLTRQESKLNVSHFYIYESFKVYTAAYRNLLKDFFLNY